MSGGFDADAPAADRAYDAAAILGLAIAQAGKARGGGDPGRDPQGDGRARGEVVHAGPDGFRKALAADQGRQAGPLCRRDRRRSQFDKNGDITGPFRLWRIQNGEVTTVGQMSTEEVDGGRRPKRRPAARAAVPRGARSAPWDGARSCRCAGERHGPDAPTASRSRPGLEISRVVTGLWQVADMERDGRALDRDAAADALADYAAAGFDSFDMADHYGSAEVIAGALPAPAARRRRPAAFTKWCPRPGR